MNVLSLFDGMSCGQIALNRLGVKYDTYFASEIDSHAIKVTTHNYPSTIQLGDVTEIKGKNLPPIHLLIGGSPCQGFSAAGDQLNFSDPRSKLFFEFVRILKETNPTYFLLENVKMKKEYMDIISKELGVQPILINSNLVSAQNRERLYWTNIPNISQPEDKGLLLKDIVQKNPPEDDLYFNLNESGNIISSDAIFIPVQKHTSKNGLMCLGGILKKNHKMWLDNGKFLQRNFSQGNRVYSENGKSTTLNANSGGLGGKTGLYKIGNRIRKLTRLECERLQTVPENYTSSVSKTQAITMLGNGWTVDVIAHIFKGLL